MDNIDGVQKTIGEDNFKEITNLDQSVE